MAKEIILDRKATDRLMAGVNKIGDAVSSTLGPKGQNVIIERNNGEIHITKDGVTVAREIVLEDPVENIGAQMIRHVAEKTVKECGDGTTTSTVLAQAIFREGLKNISAGAHPMELKKGIDIAVARVVEYLKSKSRPAEAADVERIATVSANNDASIGKIIAQAFDKVGKDGLITYEEGKGPETTLTILEGLEIDRGFQSNQFVNKRAKDLVEFDNPLILVYDKEIEVFKTLIPLLNIVAKANRPLVIIADKILGEALATLIVNNKIEGVKQGSIEVACVGCPGFGDTRRPYLEDLAVITGANYITEDRGLTLEKVSLVDLGSCDRVVIDRFTTRFIGAHGKKEEIQSRVDIVKGELERSVIPQEQQWIRKRVARLTGGVAVINVGAHSEVEMKERMDRMDDAIHATAAALEEGILPGGGVPLLRASNEAASLLSDDYPEEQKTGIKIVLAAMQHPIRKICAFAPEGAEVIIRDILTKGDDGELKTQFDWGYNPNTERLERFYETGIIDPAKVIRLCLEHAASGAGLLLTSATVIHKLPGQWQPMQAMPFPGGHP